MILRNCNILSYSDWLSLFGQESCSGCPYNDYSRAHCSYHGKCARYDEYVRSEKNRASFQLKLFV